MKLLSPLLASLALALVVPATASAGTLYKCTGADVAAGARRPRRRAP